MARSVLRRPPAHLVSYLVGYVHGRSNDVSIANAFGRDVSSDWELFLEAVTWMDTGRVLSERLDEHLTKHGIMP